jgi:hypothetical protein
MILFDKAKDKLTKPIHDAWTIAIGAIAIALIALCVAVFR